jgi:hypothetical protein
MSAKFRADTSSVLGMSWPALPSGSTTIPKNGNTYYLSGNT